MLWALLVCLILIQATISSQAFVLHPETPGYPQSQHTYQFGVVQGFEYSDEGSAVHTNMMRQIGVEWVRPVVEWSDFQNPKKVSLLDARITQYNAAGITVLLHFNMNPYCLIPEQNVTWCNANGGNRTFGEYRTFVQQLVERYDADGVGDAPGSPVVKFWQAENSPNAAYHFWRNSRQSNLAGPPNAYVRVLSEAYQAIKQADPGATVALGDLAMIYAGNQDPVLYFKGIVNAGGASYFDIVQIGGHGGSFYGTYATTIQGIRDIMTNKGLSRPIWATEIGAIGGHTLSDPSTNATITYSEEFQAGEVIKRFVDLFSKGVNTVFWYPFVDSEGTVGEPVWTDYGRQNAYGGLVREDNALKLSYNTYALMKSKLGSADSITKTCDKKSVLAYQFKFQNGRDVYVAWYSKADGKPQTTVSRSVTVSMLGVPYSTIVVTDIRNNTRTVQSTEMITLTQSPVFMQAQEPPTAPMLLVRPLKPANGVTVTCNIVLRVEVTNSSGALIAGAVVKFYLNGNYLGTSTTDVYGRAAFKFCPVPGTYNWYATAELPGYAMGQSVTYTFKV